MNCYLLILFVYKTQLLYHRGEVVSRVAKFLKDNFIDVSHILRLKNFTQESIPDTISAN